MQRALGFFCGASLPLNCSRVACCVVCTNHARSSRVRVPGHARRLLKRGLLSAAQSCPPSLHASSLLPFAGSAPGIALARAAPHSRPASVTARAQRQEQAEATLTSVGVRGGATASWDEDALRRACEEGLPDVDACSIDLVRIWRAHTAPVPSARALTACACADATAA